MEIAALIRSTVKAARKRGALWVRGLDVARLLISADGRGQLLTRIVHRGEVHQTTPFTADERYPELFDFAAQAAPGAERILSFGCSTGEELVALRRRFPEAQIVGAEINPRSRAIARRKVAADARSNIVRTQDISGTFDAVFALAVLQREPHKAAEMAVDDLSPLYPFARFDRAVGELVGRLRDGGLLCVTNAHYRVADCAIAVQLEPVPGAPVSEGETFGRDGRRVAPAPTSAVFRKLAAKT